MNENRHAETAGTEEEPLFSAFSAPPRDTTPLQPMRKLKPIAELASLTEAQLQTLDGWLSEHSYTKVLELVATPAPEGFGLQISRDKLYRHYHRQQAVAQFQDHRDLAEEIDELKLGLQASRTEDLCLELILQKAFALLLEPGHTPQTLKTLFLIATFRQRHELAQNRIRLAELKAGQTQTQTQPAEISADRSADIPVRQPVQPVQTPPPANTAPTAPFVRTPPSKYTAPKIFPTLEELAPQLTLKSDWSDHPAFAPLSAAAPSPRQAEEFRALAKAAGLTAPQLTDVVVGLIENDPAAAAQTPNKPL